MNAFNPAQFEPMDDFDPNSVWYPDETGLYPGRGSGITLRYYTTPPEDAFEAMARAMGPLPHVARMSEAELAECEARSRIPIELTTPFLNANNPSGFEVPSLSTFHLEDAYTGHLSSSHLQTPLLSSHRGSIAYPVPRPHPKNFDPDTWTLNSSRPLADTTDGGRRGVDQRPQIDSSNSSSRSKRRGAVTNATIRAPEGLEPKRAQTGVRTFLKGDSVWRDESSVPTSMYPEGTVPPSERKWVEGLDPKEIFGYKGMFDISVKGTRHSRERELYDWNLDNIAVKDAMVRDRLDGPAIMKSCRKQGYAYAQWRLRFEGLFYKLPDAQADSCCKAAVETMQAAVCNEWNPYGNRMIGRP